MNTDPISDLLTRVRNALMVGKHSVDVPASNLKREILKILVREGFIKKFVILDDGKQGIIKILLKYKDSVPVIQGIEKVSKVKVRFGWLGTDRDGFFDRIGFAIVVCDR